MHGIHLIADLHDCRCPTEHLLDAATLEARCVEACLRHGLSVVGRLFHTFASPAGESAGVTGAVILAESHLALHTWPEISAVTLDIYVCNFSGDNGAKAKALFRELITTFAPGTSEEHTVRRGELQSAQ